MADEGVQKGTSQFLRCTGRKPVGGRGAGCQKPCPVRAWNLLGDWRDESAAKKNKPAWRPPAWAVGVDKGAHTTMETVRACTVLAHNGHIYWGELRGSRVLIYAALCLQPRAPHRMWPGRVKGGLPGPGPDQLFP